MHDINDTAKVESDISNCEAMAGKKKPGECGGSSHV